MLLLTYINNTLKNSNIVKYAQAGPFLLRYGGPIPSQTAFYKPRQANLREGTCFCSALLEYLTWKPEGRNL